MPVPYYDDDRLCIVVPVAHMRNHKGNMPSTNLFAFLDEMRELLDTVPLRHRASTEINLGQIEDSDGINDGYVSVFYTREETTKERSEREREQRRWLLNRLKTVAEEERRLRAEALALGLDPSAHGFGPAVEFRSEPAMRQPEGTQP